MAVRGAPFRGDEGRGERWTTACFSCSWRSEAAAAGSGVLSSGPATSTMAPPCTENSIARIIAGISIAGTWKASTGLPEVELEKLPAGLHRGCNARQRAEAKEREERGSRRKEKSSERADGEEVGHHSASIGSSTASATIVAVFVCRLLKTAVYAAGYYNLSGRGSCTVRFRSEELR
eukprot:1991161-Pleurochrysis_carterae.AAC.10